MMNNLAKCLVISASVLTLSSCLSSAKVTPETKYVLNTMPNNIPQTSTRPITVMVGVPNATSVYDTTQMVYSTCPYQISYYAKNRWAETPAQMLQPLMVKTLARTHHFRAIVTPPFMGRYDYFLDTEVMQLQQNFNKCPATLQFVLRAQMINIATGKVTGTREFTAFETMPDRSPYGGAVAANRATAEILAELAEFSIRTTR